MKLQEFYELCANLNGGSTIAVRRFEGRFDSEVLDIGSYVLLYPIYGEDYKIVSFLIDQNDAIIWVKEIEQ